jgi:hypothetical protein
MRDAGCGMRCRDGGVGWQGTCDGGNRVLHGLGTRDGMRYGHLVFSRRSMSGVVCLGMAICVKVE